MRIQDRLRGLRDVFVINRVRSMLTLLGIMIGTGSIVTLAGLLQGAKEALVTVLIAGGTFGAWFGGNALIRNAAFAEQQHEVETTREQLATTSDLSNAFRNVGKVLEPSVVNIVVRKTVKGNGNLPFDDETLKGASTLSSKARSSSNRV